MEPEISPGANRSTTSQPVEIDGEQNVAAPTSQTGWLNLSYTEVAGGSIALLGVISWLWAYTKGLRIRKDTDFEEMRRENERHQLVIGAFKEISLALIRRLP